MLTILSVLGGAAAVEIKKIVTGGGGGGRRSRRERELEAQLETLQRDLAGEKQISSTMEASYQQAQLELEDIVKANSSLEEQAGDLRDANSESSGAAESLAQQLEHMAAERDAAHAHTAELRSQLEALQQARLEEMAEHANKVQALKAEVSSIVNRLLSRGCSEADAASALAELGCELLFVDEPGQQQEDRGATPVHQDVPLIASAPSAGTPWDGQSKLLLDDRIRIQRLMASCTATQSAGESSRLATISFPHLRQPIWDILSLPRIGAKDATGSAAQGMDAPLLHSGSSDTGLSGRDQQRVNIGSSPVKKASSRQQIGGKTASSKESKSVPQVGSWLSKLPGADDQHSAAAASSSHHMLLNQAHSLFEPTSFGGSGSENDLISTVTRDMALL